MKRRLFKTLVALLVIAAAAAGPVRGQNASPDVTLDFTTNDWGIPTTGTNHGPEDYSNGTYSITLYTPSSGTSTYRFNSGYLLLGRSGAYLQLPAFSSPVEKIEVVGTSQASAYVEQNVFVDENNEWVAVSTQTMGMKDTTQTYVIDENYRAAGNIYFIKVESSANTQITYIKVYYVSSGGGSTPEPDPEPAVPHTVRFAAGNDGWQVQDVTAAASATAPAVLENVMAGDSLVVTAPASLPGKVKSVKAVKRINPVTVPLTMEALTAGTVKVRDPQSGMKYTLNGGAKTAVTSAAINVAVGDKVAFYGNGTSITSYEGTKIAGGTADVKVYGNLMSLVDEENFATATTLTADYQFYNLFGNNAHLKDASGLLLPATTLSTACYYSMFYGCSSLTTAPELPATTLANDCYYYMFNQCDALTTAPALPATTLANDCYYYMFYGCDALTTAPALPATTLANDCYFGMFYGCAALTTAPALPATTLASNCYSFMFSGCSSLTTAPELPAPELVSSCYLAMFENCMNLNSVTCLATSGISQNSSTDSWLNGAGNNVTGTKTVNTVSSANWPTNSDSGIPSGWTRQNIDN